MEISGLAIFAVALLIAAGSPGPSVAALVARVISRGWRDVAPFVAAMWFGELVWLTFAIAGLAAIAETFHWAFLGIKYCGVAYLLYLAWRMWTAPVNINDQGIAVEPGGPVNMFLTGLAVTLGNPKIMVFYMALLPTIVNLSAITTAGWAKLAVTLLFVLAVVDIGYIVLASRMRMALRSPHAMRLANRLCASVMGAAAAAIAAR